MEVRLGSLVRGAQEAQGTAIIIDVFRAFTTAAIAFDHGVKEITLVAEPEEALELHRKGVGDFLMGEVADRKSTRLNSSHALISYAVFCLKKKQTYALTCE